MYPVYSSQTKNQGIFGYYNEYLAQKRIIFSTHGNPGSAKFIEEKFFATSNCGILTSKKISWKYTFCNSVRKKFQKIYFSKHNPAFN
ncbi:restriction endonuclease subunit S [Mesomycoplasma ovipneumoniae]|uniref:restriction endonuclease subunit S n=1 Tax=Mesomycoplasma ovipneumoniae TaxID=29562 RepID=UPI00311B3F38